LETVKWFSWSVEHYTVLESFEEESASKPILITMRNRMTQRSIGSQSSFATPDSVIDQADSSQNAIDFSQFHGRPPPMREYFGPGQWVALRAGSSQAKDRYRGVAE